MSDRHEEMLDLCAGYALDALDPDERTRLDAHLAAGCPECEREIAAYREATLAIAAGAPSVRPAPALKRRVLAAIDGGAAPATVSRLRPAASSRRWVAVAALGWAAAAAIAVAFVLQQRTLADLSVQLAGLRDEQARLNRTLAEERQWSASMASPAARVAFFAPTSGAAQRPGGWALLDPSSRRAVVVLERLSVEPGHDFELWAIRAAGPQSLGVIAVDPSGRALVRIADLEQPADLAAFAVSYEAKGGSPDPAKPSGPVVLVGSL